MYHFKPLLFTLVFVFAEDHHIESIVDMYALKADSNGKVMVKLWDNYILIHVYWHPHCHMLIVFSFWLIIYLQIISSGRSESISRAEPYLSGSVFYFLFSLGLSKSIQYSIPYYHSQIVI